MYSNNDLLEIERSIQFASTAFNKTRDLPKPVFFHSIRVGTYLYFHQYETNIVIAGYLHDLIEDTNHTEASIAIEFGNQVSSLVAANSKSSTINSSTQRNKELMKRCAQFSESAAIVKAADIIDNYYYYSSLKVDWGIEYCTTNAKFLKKYMKSGYTDKIFTELFKLVA